MADEKQITVGIAIKAIAVQKATFEEPGTAVSTDEYKGSVKLTYLIKVSPTEPLVHVSLGIHASLVPIESTSPKELFDIGFFQLTIVYEIGGMDDFERTSDKIRLPDALTEFLLHETYVTARGAWYVAARGWSAQNAVLPLVPSEQIADVITNIEDEQPAEP